LGIKDVTWINANGAEMQADDWDGPSMKCFGMMMDGRAQVTGIRKRGHDATLLLVINSYSDVVDFTLPVSPGGNGWMRLADTNAPDEEEEPAFAFGDIYRGHGAIVTAVPNGAQQGLTAMSRNDRGASV
jgi:isoamylase